jgi:hypothetical protein
MIRRGLLCAALLLASPILYIATPTTGALGAPLLFAEQAIAPPDTQSETKSKPTPEPPDAGVSAPESTPEGEPSMRMDCAPAWQANTLIGNHSCVSGRIERIVFTRKGNVRLYLCPEDKCPFHATVYAEDVERVGSLLPLRGRLVAIDGDIAMYHGVPEIKITDRDQIQAASGGLHEADVAPPRKIKEERKHQVPREKAQ